MLSMIRRAAGLYERVGLASAAVLQPWVALAIRIWLAQAFAGQQITNMMGHLVKEVAGLVETPFRFL
jgi:hypothetical protein